MLPADSGQGSEPETPAPGGRAPETQAARKALLHSEAVPSPRETQCDVSRKVVTADTNGPDSFAADFARIRKVRHLE